MAGKFLLVLMLIGVTSIPGTAAAQKSFVGCFNQAPDGHLQFGAVPSGELFTLRGHTKLAEKHVNQLVRVFGNAERAGNNKPSMPAALTIERVQSLAGSCTSVLPSTALDLVPGKVGEDTVAVPLTNTVTDRTTPGVQTEAAIKEAAGVHGASPSKNAEPVAAPPRPEQVSQSEAGANVNATSVERTEILPGKTLGVTAGESEPSQPTHSASGRARR